MNRDFFNDVPHGTLEKFKIYEQALLKWSNSINLVAVSTLDKVWERHFLDSAQVIDHLNPLDTVIDIGSGAGFPGMVLAMLGKERVHLVEKDRRRCSFLKHLAMLTSTNVEIMNTSIESVDRRALLNLEKNPLVIVSRAVAAVDDLLKISKHLVTGPTKYIILKGKQGVTEIKNSKRAQEMTWEYKSSITNPEGVLLISDWIW